MINAKANYPLAPFSEGAAFSWQNMQFAKIRLKATGRHAVMLP